MSSYPTPNIGAHVSVAGGLPNSFINADNIRATSIQIFGANPRRWQAEFPSQEKLDQFILAKKKYKIKNVFLHAPYLINLSSPDESLRLKSIRCLTDHLKIASLLKSDGLIFHAGSSYGDTTKQSFQHVIEGIKLCLAAVDEADLIIENSASHKKVGATLADISFILEKVGSPRLKVCLDSAHAYESGMVADFTSNSLYKLEKEVKNLIGYDKLVVLHANDSKTGYNSGSDRHENIGYGEIGLAGFSHLASIDTFRFLPWIMEVPGENRKGPNKANVEALLSCFL